MMYSSEKYSYDTGWMRQLDKAREAQKKGDTLRQFANGSTKPLPSWAQTPFKR